MLVAILNWNRHDETQRCLSSVLSSTYSDFAVVVVDNGSRTADVESLTGWMNETGIAWRVADAAAQPPTQREISIAFNSDNLGYAGGNNVAFRLAMTWGNRWVLVLNNDAEVPSDYIEALVLAGSSNPAIGLVGSAQSYRADLAQPTSYGVRLSYNLGALGFIRYRRGAGYRRANFCPGNAMLARTEMLRSIGLLDERYFLYSEDIEFSYRAITNGWWIVLNQDAVCVQGISTSLGERRSPTYYYYVTRNTLLFLNDRLSAGWKLISTAAFLGACSLRGAWWLATGRRRHLRAAIIGFRHFMQGRAGRMPEGAI